MTYTIRGSISIPRPRVELFALLTEPQHLQRWFAEQVQVDRVAGNIGFWGRNTPGAPAQAEGQRRILHWEEGARLGFEWKLGGVHTTVELDLADEGEGSRVALVHAGVAGRDATCASVVDFWCCALESLSQYAQTGRPGILPDYTPGQGEVRLAVDIEARPEAVWRTLVDPALLDRYCASGAVVEAVEGGKYSFGWKAGGPVRILSIVPESQLSYSWSYENEPDTVVSWTLEGSGGRTRLTLVHSGFEADRPNDDYRVGWVSFLSSMKGIAELGTAWTRPQMDGPQPDEA